MNIAPGGRTIGATICGANPADPLSGCDVRTALRAPGRCKLNADWHLT